MLTAEEARVISAEAQPPSKIIKSVADVLDEVEVQAKVNSTILVINNARLGCLSNMVLNSLEVLGYKVCVNPSFTTIDWSE